jgi:hypothetical protein
MWVMLRLGWFFAVSAACTPLPERTGIEAVIDADDGLRARIDHVAIEVHSGAEQNGARDTQLTQRLATADASAWPVRFAWRRQNADERSYRVSARAEDSAGRAIAEVQARSDYAGGHTLQLELRFDEACAARADGCPTGQSCLAGACVDDFVMASELPQVAAPEQAATTTSAAQSSNDAGASGSGCDGGAGRCSTADSCSTRGDCPTCPAGFIADGAACLPALSALTVTSGTLTPPFAAAATAYTLELPLVSERLELKFSTDLAVDVEIDGVAAPRDTAWSAPSPDIGAERTVTLRLRADGRTSRDITVRVKRSGKAEVRLQADMPSTDGELGRTLALEGDTLVVGAPLEDSAAGGGGSSSLTDSGAAYVFVRDAASGSWRSRVRLQAEAVSAQAQFGSAVAIDGRRIVVAARGEGGMGAAHVFEDAGSGRWQHTAVLRPDADVGGSPEFGCSVAVQGDRIAVGACGDDSVATDSGSVYVFSRDPSQGTWSRTVRLKTQSSGTIDWFGASVAFAGDLLASGASSEVTGGIPGGVVHVFSASADFREIASLHPDPVSAGAFFGDTLAMSGDTIAVGNFNGTAGLTAGAVFVFVRQADGSFQQQARLQASNAAGGDTFGHRIALESDHLLVGAPYESAGGSGIGAATDGKLDKSGAAYLFVRDAGTWRERVRIKAPEPAAQQNFGFAVALSGEWLAISANRADTDTAAGSGAVQLIH